jgi:hypothetical protein
VPQEVDINHFSTTVYVVLCRFLVPEFPLWILLAYGFVYTPIISYVAARMEGIAGQWVDIPMVREATVLLAGFSCGMGLISMFSLGCLLISKAVFQLPY